VVLVFLLKVLVYVLVILVEDGVDENIKIVFNEQNHHFHFHRHHRRKKKGEEEEEKKKKRKKRKKKTK